MRRFREIARQRSRALHYSLKHQFAAAVACTLASAYCGPLRAAADPASGDTRLHLEACTKWTERNGSFGFTNECGEPVALLFIELNGPHRFDRLIPPNERFDIGLPAKTINETGWLFTACPAGYVPNVPFTTESQAKIVKSQYECVRK